MISRYIRNVQTLGGMAAGLTLVAVLGSPVAEAASLPVSKGQAQAVFEAFGTGRLAILNQEDSRSRGAVVDIDRRASIRPIPEGFEGRHFCAEDWHVLMLATIDGGDNSFTRQEAGALLDPTVVELYLDGGLLAGERTPIKRLNFPQVFFDDLEVAYYFTTGTILAPDDLSVGGHTLSYVRVDGQGNTDSEQITFRIDAAGTGVCLLSS